MAATSSYERERDLFQACLALEPKRRELYLRRICKTDQELLERVVRLLAAHSRAEQITLSPIERQEGHFSAFHPSAASEGGAIQSTNAFPEAGSIVGVWRLIRMIGAGGMASVWLAEPCEEQGATPVALKLPHDAWQHHIARERIERERDLLRTLKHPNIARLLDAGVTSEGQPYLALEYVAGQRIDEYCRLRDLSVPARLHLFLQVTRAISYSHNKLIVHRDIKPSNILVAHDHTVRVLDFGIAKILEGGRTCETELTRCSGHVFTLEYASPEQVLGQPLTVSSDVYSLGIVLYELLTDSRPYRLKRCSRTALEEAVLTMEPRRPSEAASSRSRRRALCGDLDTIVMKTVKKDPGARYASVEELADDIERYFENRPVKAQRDRWGYRFSKFIRRNYIILSAALVLVMAICAVSAMIAWQARIAVQQNQRAESEKAFLISMLFDTHSYWGNGKPVSVVQLLKQMRKRAESLTAADPEGRVEILNLIAASLLSQQETSDAEATAIGAVKEAEHLQPNHRMALRARMLRSWVRLYRGQFGALGSNIDELVSDMRRSPEVLPEDLAGAFRIRSAVARENGDAQTAETFALEALHIAERRLGIQHNQSVLALIDLSYAYLLGNKNAMALSAADRARLRALQVYHGYASHPNVVKARVAYAQALAATGRRDDGARELHRAIDDSATLFGPSSRAVGLDLLKLARLELQRGNAGAALDDANRAEFILKDHFDNAEIGMAGVLEVRGTALLAANQRERGINDLAAADRLLSRAFGPYHARALRIRTLLSGAQARKYSRLLRESNNDMLDKVRCKPPAGVEATAHPAARLLYA